MTVVPNLICLLASAALIVVLLGCATQTSHHDNLAVPALEPSGAKSAELEILARVNGEPVSRIELQRLLDDPLERDRFQKEPGAQDPDSKELERLALQKLIHRRLFLQEGARRNLTVSDEELDQAITALRRRFPDLKSFGKWMKESGLDDSSLFDTVREQMLMTRVWDELVEEVRLTEKEVQDYYETHKENLIIGEEVRLRLIAVNSMAEAKEILLALKNGENFSRLARERSIGKRAARGGDTGWVDPLTLPQPLREIVSGLKEGDASRPLQKNTDEFLIVGLQGRRLVRAKSLTEARPEIERRLLPAKQQEAVQSWLADQEEKSKIEKFLQSE